MASVHRMNHVGSWLRPQEVKDLRSKAVKGDISQEELRKQTDPFIAQVVKDQQKVGLQDISDGKPCFRKSECYKLSAASL